MASLSSKALENAIEQFATLPGIGRKTALRFALHMLRQKPEEVKRFADSLTALKTDIRECKRCHNIADGDLCEICGDSRRDASTICVVENIKDILSTILQEFPVRNSYSVFAVPPPLVQVSV